MLNGMARRLNMQDRLTLAFRLADGSLLPVEGSPDAMRFIGRYARLRAFGAIGARLEAHVVANR
jgi:hypothetical protein